MENQKVKEFIENTAKEYGFKYADIVGRSRAREVVDVRAKIARVLRNEWHMSYPSIAAAMSRDHTSIMALVLERGKRKSFAPS